jgi:acetyl esterase/lipase
MMRALTFATTVLVAALGASAEDTFEKESGVHYADPNGKTMKLTRWSPRDKEAGPRPGILLIHGGAWAMGSRKKMRPYGEAFAEAGYVAVSVDYRKLPKYAFPHCLHDVKAAVRWMRLNAEDLGLDPNRIAVMGQSAGGHLAALLATTAQEENFKGDANSGPSSAVQSAIVMYGPTDLRPLGAYIKKNEGRLVGRRFRRFFSDFFTREQQGVVDPYGAASPVLYVDEQTSPIFLIHGADDKLVTTAHSRAMLQAMAQAGVPGKLIELEGEKHAFDHGQPDLRRSLVEQMIAFLNEHMKAPENAAAAKQ